MALLGDRCALCGAGESASRPLEVDHINGRQWAITRTASHQRLKRYLEEAKKGLLRALCKPCNVREGNRGNQKWRPGRNVSY